MKAISSRQNPLVRLFRELADTPDSSDTRVLLDGLHLVREARAAALEFEAVALASSHVIGETEEGELARALESTGAPVFTVSDAVFSAMSPVRSPSGIAAIARRTPSDGDAIIAANNGFTLVAADVQDHLVQRVQSAQGVGVQVQAGRVERETVHNAGALRVHLVQCEDRVVRIVRVEHPPSGWDCPRCIEPGLDVALEGVEVRGLRKQPAEPDHGDRRWDPHRGRPA